MSTQQISPMNSISSIHAPKPLRASQPALQDAVQAAAYSDVSAMQKSMNAISFKTEDIRDATQV